MSRNGRRILATVIGGAGLMLAAGAVSGCGQTEDPAGPEAMRPGMSMPMIDRPTPFIMPGLKQPPTESADSAEVDDGAEVIGVSTGSRSRAYLCTALSGVASHVVNDVLGEIPVTVTYCDRTQCGRSFTQSGTTQPLGVDLGGWSGEKLLLRINGRMLPQDSREIALEEIASVKTTWGEWKSAHPETDIYTGKTAKK